MLPSTGSRGRRHRAIGIPDGGRTSPGGGTNGSGQHSGSWRAEMDEGVGRCRRRTECAIPGLSRQSWSCPSRAERPVLGRRRAKPLSTRLLPRGARYDEAPSRPNLPPRRRIRTAGAGLWLAVIGPSRSILFLHSPLSTRLCCPHGKHKNLIQSCCSRSRSRSWSRESGCLHLPHLPQTRSCSLQFPLYSQHPVTVCRPSLSSSPDFP